jgi:hypothetical protein
VGEATGGVEAWVVGVLIRGGGVPGGDMPVVEPEVDSDARTLAGF